MIDAETSLVLAVRTRLQSVLAMTAQQCDIEPDEMVPAIAGAEYIAVLPAGVQAGPRHKSSGGVWDLYVSVRVVVFHRVAELPRDRRRSALLDRYRGLNSRLSEVVRAVDYVYAINDLATADVNQAGDERGEFVEPLKLAQTDPTIGMVSFDLYAAQQSQLGDPIVALKRGVLFTGSRFVGGR